MKDNFFSSHFWAFPHWLVFWRDFFLSLHSHSVKGDINNFDSYRGIFRSTVLRNVLDRLRYNDAYETFDNNLTDCNIGSRKRRNICDNLVVINAITNSSKKGIDRPCDIRVYDVRKCFETLWLDKCINNLYEAGIQDNMLCLLYYQNKNARIAINTFNGRTEWFTIQNTVMHIKHVGLKYPQEYLKWHILK